MEGDFWGEVSEDRRRRWVRDIDEDVLKFFQEQIRPKCRPHGNPFKIVLSSHYSTDRGASFFDESRYSIYIKEERSCNMLFILAGVVILLLSVLAGADLFVSQYNPDELSNMGVQEQ